MIGTSFVFYKGYIFGIVKKGENKLVEIYFDLNRLFIIALLPRSGFVQYSL